MFSTRILAAVSACAFLGACSTTQVSTFETDASAALADVQAAAPLIAAVPGVPSWFVADITLADNGLTGILAAVTANSTMVEAASLSGAQTAIADFRSDLPNNATVQTDAGLAETALAALSSAQSQSAETQAFTALAALALAVEQAEQGTSARMGAVSPVQNLINDGRGHLANLGG